jgi:DNA/RNA-binding domain of Phe-tRNA-synthetase-like protein
MSTMPSITIQGELSGRVRLGWLILHGRRPGVAEAALTAEIRACEAACRQRWSGLQPSRIPGLAEARRLYRRTGVDPTRTRPSSEALLRRVLKGGSLYAISNAVDAGNLLSLETLLPLGLYDLGAITGAVVCRKGEPGEAYPGIRKDEVHLAGRLGLFDEAGPFGSPTSDSPRTAISEATRDLLLVFFATSDAPGALLAGALDRGAALFARHCGAADSGRGIVG